MILEVSTTKNAFSFDPWMVESEEAETLRSLLLRPDNAWGWGFRI